MVDAVNNNNSQEYYASRQVEEKTEKTPDQDNAAKQTNNPVNNPVNNAQTGSGIQNQILQVLATQQPVQQIQQTAQSQISKGFLDIRV